MFKQFSSIWAAAICSVALLYGFLAAHFLYQHDPNLHQGIGALPKLLALPVVFLGGWLAAGTVLGFACKFVTDSTARAGLLLAAVVVYMIDSGEPSLIAMILAVLVFPLAYFADQRARKDQQDLDDFMEK